MSDDNVIDLKSRRPAKPRITDPAYECGVCGCQEFYLRPPSIVECADCGGTHDHLIWGQVFQSKTCPPA